MVIVGIVAGVLVKITQHSLGAAAARERSSRQMRGGGGGKDGKIAEHRQLELRPGERQVEVYLEIHVRKTVR